LHLPWFYRYARRFPFRVREARRKLPREARSAGHRVIVREPAKVQSPEVKLAITGIIEDYKKSFEQESVLWETARVCAAF
jgi:hypothetical protein